MAVNPDNLPPERPYSRTETDLKMQNLEQRLDSKLDQVLGKFDSFETKLNGRFTAIEKDIYWLRNITTGTFFLVLAAILKLFFHLG